MVSGRTSLCPWCMTEVVISTCSSTDSHTGQSSAPLTLQIMQVIPDTYLVLPPVVINSLSHIHTP